MSQKLDNNRRNLWTSSAKEMRSPELTAAMTLEESLQNGCTNLGKRLLVWVEASSYFSELRSQ